MDKSHSLASKIQCEAPKSVPAGDKLSLLTLSQLPPHPTLLLFPTLLCHTYKQEM